MVVRGDKRILGRNGARGMLSEARHTQSLVALISSRTAWEKLARRACIGPTRLHQAMIQRTCVSDTMTLLRNPRKRGACIHPQWQRFYKVQRGG